jgi:hypothetical protein
MPEFLRPLGAMKEDCDLNLTGDTISPDILTLDPGLFLSMLLGMVYPKASC